MASGPIKSSMDIIRWGLGSTTVRMAEDYIYVRHQRTRIAQFIELLELLNPYPRWKNWLDFLSGRWRLLYSTGRHVGLTLHQPSPRVLINNAFLTFTPSYTNSTFLLASEISFTVMPSFNWPHNKSGTIANLHIKSTVTVSPGRRLYLREENNNESRSPFGSQESIVWKVSSRKWKEIGTKELPFGLPVAKFVAGEIDIEMKLDPMPSSNEEVGNVLREVRTRIPPEMFDGSKIVCRSYVDLRLMVLRGVNGSALLFTRSIV